MGCTGDGLAFQVQQSLDDELQMAALGLDQFNRFTGTDFVALLDECQATVWQVGFDDTDNSRFPNLCILEEDFGVFSRAVEIKPGVKWPVYCLAQVRQPGRIDRVVSGIGQVLVDGLTVGFDDGRHVKRRS